MAARDAFEEALAAWRAHRAAELVPLVAEARAKAAATLPAAALPMSAKLSKAELAALCERMAELPAAHYVELVSTLSALLSTSRGTWPLVEVLADLPADPLLGELCLRLLETFDALPHTSAKLWRRLVDGVEHHGDVRAVARLEALDKTRLYEAQRARLGNVAKRLAAAVRPPDLAALGLRLAAVTDAPSVAPESRPEEELLAAVYAAPDDDAARAVYADALLARGDVRGELIALQLERARTGALASKRELALLKKHQHEWLAPIWPLLARKKAQPFLPLVFERGFLSEVAYMMVPRGKATALHHPLWSTVCVLGGTITRIGAHMRSLRRVEALSSDAFPSLRALDSTLPLEELVVIEDGLGGFSAPIPQLAKVRQLTVHARGHQPTFALIHEILTQPWELEALLVLFVSYTNWRWDWAVLDAHRGLARLTVALEPRVDGERLTLVRRSDGRFDAELTVNSVWSLREWQLVFEPFAGPRRLATLVAIGRRSFRTEHVPPFVDVLRAAADEVRLEGSFVS